MVHRLFKPGDVNEEISSRDFKFYIFDWDDNILHMPTRIYLEHRVGEQDWQPIRVSTSTFVLVRGDAENYRFPLKGGAQAAFRDFRDTPRVLTSDLAFIRDTRAALARVKAGEAPGPSFLTLRKTLREGRMFAIVTARGHAASTLREAVKIFIDEVLSPNERTEMMANLRGYRRTFDHVEKFGTDEEELNYYLSICRYHAVTNPDFCERLADDADFGPRYAQASTARAPELAKEFAIRDFVEHLFRTLQRTGGFDGRRQVSVGFSDDDAGNVNAVSKYIQKELSNLFPAFKFVVYDTSDPTLSHGRKFTICRDEILT